MPSTDICMEKDSNE